jgi:glucose-6-phosphate isomerase
MEVLAEPRTINPTVKRPAWKALEGHYKRVRKLHLKKLPADDSTRGERMTAEAVGIFLDYSKNRITDEPTLDHDGSTNNLICRYRKLKEN